MLDALAEHALDCDQQPAHRARPGRVGSCTWCDFLERYERAFTAPSADEVRRG